VKGGRVGTAVLAVVAAALLAATRVPSPSSTAFSRAAVLGAVHSPSPSLAVTWAAVVLAALVAVFGLLAAARPSWGWASPVGLAATVAAIAVPSSAKALLVGVPAAIVALPCAALMLRLYPRDSHDSPWVGPARGRLATALRLLPLAAGLAFLVLAPLLLARFAPDRLAASSELAGAAGPLVAAALAAAALVGLGLLVRAKSRIRARPASQPAEAKEGTS